MVSWLSAQSMTWGELVHMMGAAKVKEMLLGSKARAT